MVPDVVLHKWHRALGLIRDHDNRGVGGVRQTTSRCHLVHGEASPSEHHVLFMQMSEVYEVDELKIVSWAVTFQCRQSERKHAGQVSPLYHEVLVPEDVYHRRNIWGCQ